MRRPALLLKEPNEMKSGTVNEARESEGICRDCLRILEVLKTW